MRTTHCLLDFVERSSFNFWSSWRLRVFSLKYIMAESQLKSMIGQESDLPSKIFGSKNKDSRKKQVLPMAMPPLEGIVQRWDFYEAKVSGNPKKGEPERLQCSPVNADNFLPYNSNYIPRRKSGIYWIQVRRAAAAAVEISLWTR